jgi:hypothetical protein
MTDRRIDEIYKSREKSFRTDPAEVTFYKDLGSVARHSAQADDLPVPYEASKEAAEYLAAEIEAEHMQTNPFYGEPLDK